MKLDLVQVNLVYAFDIGIASSHLTQTFNETPADGSGGEGEEPTHFWYVVGPVMRILDLACDGASKLTM